MINAKLTMKMPELSVFVRFLAAGFLIAESYRIALYVGTSFASALFFVPIGLEIPLLLAGLALCSMYAAARGAFVAAKQMINSRRVDLLMAVGAGVWANELVSPWLAKVHSAVKAADPYWALVILIMLCAVLFPSLIKWYFQDSEKMGPEPYFMADEEIRRVEDDLLESEKQVEAFAKSVLESNAHSGLIFGVDGPWGVGKTSFINLAESYWKKAGDKVIVCRFEPLRYASESDIVDRMIRDLSAAIQKSVFAPEFRPVVSRYSRLIKGKADLSFFGFKISLEPGQETVDELLEDIDDVLRRIGRRVIIVVDDLDRLDPKAVSNILFAARRTFKLSQAAYVLCFDTEVLVGGKGDDSAARDFLEKFVAVKLNLFVDSSRVRDFLRRDWAAGERLSMIPSDAMVKFGEIFSTLADILEGKSAAKYLPLVGDLRKVKRFVNSMLLMQLEKSDLGRTDFNKQDLINLVLIYLNYPGLFRRIYAEETEGRSGIFSVRSTRENNKYINSEEFSALAKELPETAGFLLAQLFDPKMVRINSSSDVRQEVLASRACFNQPGFRTLEGFLKLIVRFEMPEIRGTFALYRDAIKKIIDGNSFDSVLTSAEFDLKRGEYAHDQFWRVFVSQSYEFPVPVVDRSIDALVNYLPRYSSIDEGDRGLRPRSIYSLVRLLDRAGWKDKRGRRYENNADNTVEIAWRIFGEGPHRGKSLLQRFIVSDRGVLGWNDLMLFRLQCSADRQGQLQNLHSALIRHQDPEAPTTGPINGLALMGMRMLSQEVFRLFKRVYIDPRRNFFFEADSVSDEALLGDASRETISQMVGESQDQSSSISQKALSARAVLKSFVIYQLSNSLPPTGSGVGCGHYDESGSGDDGGIANLMNKYVFGICFNPAVDENNIFHFLDHCLLHLTNPFFAESGEDRHFATRAGIVGGFDEKELRQYWVKHAKYIRKKVVKAKDRSVALGDATVTYRDDLAGVFVVLDALASEKDQNENGQ